MRQNESFMNTLTQLKEEARNTYIKYCLESPPSVLDEIVTTAYLKGLERAKEIAEGEYVRYPDTGKVQEDSYNYGIMNVSNALTTEITNIKEK